MEKAVEAFATHLRVRLFGSNMNLMSQDEGDLERSAGLNFAG